MANAALSVPHEEMQHRKLNRALELTRIRTNSANLAVFVLSSPVLSPAHPNSLQSFGK